MTSIISTIREIINKRRLELRRDHLRCKYCKKIIPKNSAKPLIFCRGKNGNTSLCKHNYYYEARRVPYFQAYYRNKVVPRRIKARYEKNRG